MKNIKYFVQTEKHEIKKSVRSFLPLYASIPLSQLDSGLYEPTVKAGDSVKEGQTIGVLTENDGSYGADVNASVSGKIDSITEILLPSGKISKAVKIKTGGSFKYLGKKLQETDWKSKSPENIVFELKDKGVVNTFNGTSSLADQIKNYTIQKNRFLIVRLFDEDPGIYTDLFVSKNYTAEVVKGAHVVSHAMKADGIIFVVSKNVFERPDVSYITDIPCLLCEADTGKYPSGSKQDLIKTIKKAESSINDKFRNVNTNCIFIDSVTAYSAWEACAAGIPVVERFVHVCGECINASAVLRVRIGTPLKDLVNQCGGLKTDSNLVIINGMLKGSAVPSLDITVTKSIKSIEFTKRTEFNDATISSCIHCGRCRSICPEHLYPDMIFHNRNDRDLINTAMLCSGCNLCNTVCPSRIALSQTISLVRGKNAI
ncbi:4Fe-4S dicluster domain-containing protein [Treponema rectale]|uniref:4Fe-4S dicluster domain-containing protein n=1 Tax=Treponema rectale TaxID=744512 RepID=A0A840SFZ6_9SPIR|nr:SLBB domain-containing protein [Treponema rectale]MBB5218362.1 electron transport complex protein RnfC [Treponema rectale]QOS39941.1 4Fe-4S dicluster domain-containing protein [Treponema rectale]